MLPLILVMGSVLVLCSLYLLFFVKNVRSEGPPPGRSPNCCVSTCRGLRSAARYSCRQKVLLLLYVGIFGSFILIFASNMSITTWISKYLYDGDTKATARHIRLLGIQDPFKVLVFLGVGVLFDRYSERFLIPAFFALASSSVIALYFVTPLNAPLAFAIQITAGVFSEVTQGVVFMSLSKHALSEIKGAIFTLASLTSTLSSVGFFLLNGPLIDSPSYNKLIFLTIGGFSLLVGVLFLLVALCCPHLYVKPKTPQHYAELSDEISYQNELSPTQPSS